MQFVNLLWEKNIIKELKFFNRREIFQWLLTNETVPRKLGLIKEQQQQKNTQKIKNKKEAHQNGMNLNLLILVNLIVDHSALGVVIISHIFSNINDVKAVFRPLVLISIM